MIAHNVFNVSPQVANGLPMASNLRREVIHLYKQASLKFVSVTEWEIQGLCYLVKKF